MPYSFGASAYDRPTTATAPPRRDPGSNAPGLDLQALVQAFIEAQDRTNASRERTQSHEQFGRHLGMGGAEITKENPMGETGLAADPAFWNKPFTGGFQPTDPAARRATLDQQHEAGIFHPVGNVMAPPPTQTVSGYNPSWFETGGKTNMTPPNQTFDPSMFAEGGMSTNQSGPRSGTVISDETGPRYKAPKQPFAAGASASPKKRFSW